MISYQNNGVFKNIVYTVFLVIILVLSAVTIPAATAIKGEQINSENATNDIPEQDVDVDDQDLELATPVSDNYVINNGFVPRRVYPEFDLTRWEDGWPMKRDLTEKYSYASNSQNSKARANEDLEMTGFEFGVQNAGWTALYDDPNQAGNQAYFGSFFIGVSTPITVDVKNNPLLRMIRFAFK